MRGERGKGRIGIREGCERGERKGTEREECVRVEARFGGWSKIQVVAGLMSLFMNVKSGGKEAKRKERERVSLLLASPLLEDQNHHRSPLL